MADIYVTQIPGAARFTAAVASGITLGALVYHDGTRFALSDADLHTTPAEYLVIGTDQSAVTDKRATLSRVGIITDEDAPYTLGNVQYLSTTAGGITTTLPTGSADLRQIVGRAISTSQVEVNIHQPRLHDDFYPSAPYNTSGETSSTLHLADAGWTGPQLDAAGETSYVGPHSLPYGFLSLLEARLVYDNIGGTAALDYDFTITGGYDGASNVQDTGTAITAGDVVGTPPADNILEYFDLSVMFDAGFVGPGRLWSVLVDPDGVGSADQVILGIRLVMLVTN